jgi:hypothetical protein
MEEIEILTLIYNKRTSLRRACKDAKRICKKNYKQTQCMAVVHNTKKYGAHIHIATEKPIAMKHMEEKATTKKQHGTIRAFQCFADKTAEPGCVVKSRLWSSTD